MRTHRVRNMHVYKKIGMKYMHRTFPTMPPDTKFLFWSFGDYYGRKYRKYS